ncbi:MAG: DSD1 family PLP-dependent enzyme [Lentisphaeria bacterium]|nr:DSD1 family PLP-dependent enzyme [Lentisphaeria bacterium]
MLKNELDTPSLILDLDLFEQNHRKVRSLAEAAGKKLRPHAKTHKCPDIAKLQSASGGCVGVCAAKLSEAEKLADAGISDILITSPVAAPWKIARLPELDRRSPGLMITADHPDQVRALARTAAGSGRRLRILVDVDPEMGRTGVAFSEAPEFAGLIASYPSLELVGMQCYAGHLQHIPSWDERRKTDLRLMEKAAAVFRRIRSAIPSCRIFTGTGTGTLPADLNIPELTDVQVGSYGFMDSEYLAVEHGCGAFLPALRIVTSVISANHRNFATVDAGTKAVYVTPGAPPRVIRGNGFLPGWEYDWSFGDEHGRVVHPEGEVLRPGDRLEMCVSHCDPTINLFDVIYGCRGDEVERCFPVTLRGCCR